MTHLGTKRSPSEAFTLGRRKSERQRELGDGARYARIGLLSAALAVAGEAILLANLLNPLVQLFAVVERRVRTRVGALVARQQVGVLVFDEAQVELLDVRRQAQRRGREVRGLVLTCRGSDGLDR